MDLFTRCLYKTAEKTSSLCSVSNGGLDWLERFKGTPLHDQAVLLLQEELQQEAEELQSREMSSQLYSVADQIRLKKRLLELELARQETIQPTLSPAEKPQAPTAETLAPGSGTQPSIMPPEGAPMKNASVPLALLRQLMEKQALSGAAGLGEAALGFIRKNPGLVAGAGLGALGGGAAGAQQGGVTGALTGAAGGGVLGGAAGLGAQGAIRSGLKADEIMKAYKAKGMAAPGGLVGVLGRQAASRAGNFAQEASTGAKDLVGKLRSVRNSAGQVVPVPPITASPTPPITAT